MDTGFFLGGAIAFLLALLGWGDQIRGAQEKTQLAEKQFLRRYKFRWADLQPLIRPNSDDDAEKRLQSVLKILLRDEHALKEGSDITLLTQVERMNSIRNRLEPRYALRFLLIYFIAAELFIAGVLSFFLKGRARISLPEITLHGPTGSWRHFVGLYDWNHIWTAIWLVLFAVVLCQTWLINKDEEKLRKALVEIDDKLREAADDSDNGAL